MEGKEQEAESQDTDVGKTGGDPVPLPPGGVSPPFSSGPEKMVKDSKATPAGRPLSIRIKEEPNDDIKTKGPIIVATMSSPSSSKCLFVLESVVIFLIDTAM
ncbi:hypothetical protein C0Q70_10844 [Pomacea canaliculata]|uniref:Uncharacterized protein n=1 Tax=Pomacea canaliculata TaxID=400727 RepID=A0A2T7P4A7_POMCA|nr:hypothetical protein C0Q70_10844 [Pomacea canaliculata]